MNLPIYMILRVVLGIHLTRGRPRTNLAALDTSQRTQSWSKTRYLTVLLHRKSIAIFERLPGWYHPSCWY